MKFHWIVQYVGRDNSVSIATRYRLDGPGSNPGWEGEIFRIDLNRLLGPPSLLYSGYWVILSGYIGRSVSTTYSILRRS
jgi:hypothetical protein